MAAPKTTRDGSPALPLLLDARTTARMLAISVRTLRRWSATGGGPRTVRVGRRGIRWNRADVLAWADPRDEDDDLPIGEEDCIGVKEFWGTGKQAAARVRELMQQDRNPRPGDVG